MRAMMKDYDSNESSTRLLSDANLIRQSTTVIAHGADEDIMETMADMGRKTAGTLKHRERVSSHEESGRVAPEVEACSAKRLVERSPQTCVHLARHFRL